MKVNKMIGKAMAATVVATVMLGGATVMAAENEPTLCPWTAQEPEQTEEAEEADDALFHTGDILHITDEPTSLPAGVYRIYYTEINGVVVLLINVGDKSDQSKDIVRAKKLLDEWRLSQ